MTGGAISYLANPVNACQAQCFFRGLGDDEKGIEQLRLFGQEEVDQQDSKTRLWQSLEQSYGRQREQSNEAYDKAISQADRQALSRGMQRSSYNNATLANLQDQKVKAQNDITSAQIAINESLTACSSSGVLAIAIKLPPYIWFAQGIAYSVIAMISYYLLFRQLSNILKGPKSAQSALFAGCVDFVMKNDRIFYLCSERR